MSESQSTRRRGIAFGRAVPISTLPNVLDAPFPERRTIHWLPPDRVTTEDFSLVVTPEVLLQTSRHVAKTLEHEMGGFLLGNRYQCPNTGREYIIIDQYVEADFAESTDVSLTFTHEAWGNLEDKLTGKYYGKKLVGWYHSHPGMSIFLSEHDLVIHRERFPEPWMVALVLEPEKHLGGFFVWSNGKVDPNQYVNFYELLEGDRRESVVAWKNYDGLDPVKGIPPTLSAVNSNTSTTPGAASRSPESVPGPPPVHYRLPDWLHGNLFWFGGAMVALAVFCVVLYFVTRPPQNTSHADGDSKNSPAKNVFKDAKFTVEDRGEVNFETNKIIVRLKLSGLPEGVADKVKTEVFIQGQQAKLDLSANGDELPIEASIRSKEIAKKLAQTRGQDSQILISAAFKYKGETHDERLDQPVRVSDDRDENLVFNFVPRSVDATNTPPSLPPNLPPNTWPNNRPVAKESDRKEQERKEEARREKERKEQDRREQERRDQERTDRENRAKEAATARNDDNGRRVQLKKEIDGLMGQLNGLEDRLNRAAPNSKERNDLQKQVQRTRGQLDKKRRKLTEREQ